MIKDLADISDEQLEDMLSVLNLLAKRKNPDIKWWTSINIINDTTTCNICNSYICSSSLTGDVASENLLKHMLFHLKESNLLVLL